MISKEAKQAVISSLLITVISYAAVAYVNDKHGEAMTQIEVQKAEITNLKLTIERIDRNIFLLLERRR